MERAISLHDEAAVLHQAQFAGEREGERQNTCAENAETLEAVLARVAAAEASRHERIEAVIEAAAHRAL